MANMRAMVNGMQGQPLNECCSAARRMHQRHQQLLGVLVHQR